MVEVGGFVCVFIVHGAEGANGIKCFGYWAFAKVLVNYCSKRLLDRATTEKKEKHKTRVQSTASHENC